MFVDLFGKLVKARKNKLDSDESVKRQPYSKIVRPEWANLKKSIPDIDPHDFEALVEALQSSQNHLIQQQFKKLLLLVKLTEEINWAEISLKKDKIEQENRIIQEQQKEREHNAHEYERIKEELFTYWHRMVDYVSCKSEDSTGLDDNDLDNLKRYLSHSQILLTSDCDIDKELYRYYNWLVEKPANYSKPNNPSMICDGLLEQLKRKTIVNYRLG